MKKLGGVFNAALVDSFQGIFDMQAQKLVENMKAEVGGKPFDILQKYLAGTTLEAICRKFYVIFMVLICRSGERINRLVKS